VDRDASLSHKSLIQTRNPFKQNHKRWIKLSITWLSNTWMQNEFDYPTYNNILENEVRQIQIQFSKISTYEEQTMQSSRAFDVHL